MPKRGISFLFLLLLLFYLIPASADVFDDIGANFYNYCVSPNLDPGDPIEGAAIDRVETACDEHFSKFNADGSFNDIDYDDNSDGWSTHLGRLWAWSLMYVTPNNKYYQDSSVPNAVEKGLDYVNPIVYDATSWGDWYNKEILIPRQYTNLLQLLVQGNVPVDANAIDGALANLDKLVVKDFASRHKDQSTGANGIWFAINLLHYAVLKKDMTLLNYLNSHVPGIISIRTAPPTDYQDAGIQPDYSFKQHQGAPLTGNYGVNGMGYNGGIYITVVSGTPYALPDSSIHAYVDWVVEGLSWAIYKGKYDPAIRGRYISTPGQEANTGLCTMAIAAGLPSDRQTEIMGRVKSIMQNSDLLVYLCTLDDLTAILDSAVPAQEPLGHKHYWRVDHTVHRDNDWFASLKMYSYKVPSYENYNSMNKKGWHRSSGWLYVVLDGDEYYGGNGGHVPPTLNWDHLPGTTVEQVSYSTYIGDMEHGSKHFVGGVYTDQFGVSAMDFKPAPELDSSLTAKKSWFFFDDEIVALGSDIDCNPGNEVHTTINQWPLANGNEPFYVDGQSELPNEGNSGTFNDATWAHCDDIGYYFPGSQTIRASRMEQSGRWRDLSSGHWFTGDTTIRYNTFLNLWFNHGNGPSNAKYAYGVLPRKTRAETQTYAAGNPLTVLAHDNNVHAVKDNDLNAVGAVFWSTSGGQAGKITAKKALVLACGSHLAGTTTDLVWTISIVFRMGCSRLAGVTAIIASRCTCRSTSREFSNITFCV